MVKALLASTGASRDADGSRGNLYKRKE